MTNREKILEKMGDSLIAYQLIEKVHCYKNQYDYRQRGWGIAYKFNGKIYHNFDEAFKALKAWLDEEEKTDDEDSKTTRVVCPPPVHDWRKLSDKEREECARGCVHPEDTWTKWWCGDCGAYANYCGCRGPSGLGKDNSTPHKN